MKNVLTVLSEIFAVICIIGIGICILVMGSAYADDEGQCKTYYCDDMYIDSIKVPSLSDSETTYPEGSYYEGLTETQKRFVEESDSNAPTVEYRRVTTSTGYTYIYETENGTIVNRATVSEPAKKTEGEIYKQDSSPTAEEWIQGEVVTPVYGPDSYYEGLTETEKDWFNGDIAEVPDVDQFVINEEDNT